MIQSMTGFGHYELVEDGKKYTVEIKTVNHRYLDLNIKMPKKFNIFETEIRNVLKDYIKRGKSDLYITYEDTTQSDYSVRYNEALVAQYLKAAEDMSEQFALKNDMTVTKMSKFPDVLIIEEGKLDEDKTLKQLTTAVEGAAKQLVSARHTEGMNLKADLLDKLELLTEEVKYIEAVSPEIVNLYQNKLQEKLENLLNDAGVEQSRILTEVTIFADKICVDEEIVRLKSHIASVKDVLEEEDSIGRKLDFIVQEMNREANTILSKANNIDISNHRINIKTEIEKIREQIQNIE